MAKALLREPALPLHPNKLNNFKRCHAEAYARQEHKCGLSRAPWIYWHRSVLPAFVGNR